MKTPDRIERKIVRLPFSGCWIWMGSAGRYGRMHFNGRIVQAHRAIFAISGQQVPPGLELLHSCDIGVCVNPDHLAVGTHQENMTDMARKGRARAPRGDAHWTKSQPERARTIARQNIRAAHASGEANSNSRASLDKATALRACYLANPSQTMTDLGRQFQLGRETARKIIMGIAWKS